MLVPLFAVLLFLAAIATAFWYLRHEEIMREEESIQRDLGLVHQQIHQQLLDDQDVLLHLTREINHHELTPARFTYQMASPLLNRSEIIGVSWLDESGHEQARALSPSLEPAQIEAPGAASPAGLPASAAQLIEIVRSERMPRFTPPYRTRGGQVMFQLWVPILDEGRYSGVLVADLDVDGLLRALVPSDVAQRHLISLIDEQGQWLAGTSGAIASSRQRELLTQTMALSPIATRMLLRGEGFRASVGLIGNTLVWMVMALSALTVWTLFGSWRHMQRRTQIQRALERETTFRRTMENSMPTGMRAMDHEGRITYVNPSFCALTGFAEHELVGHLPPFPYWPPGRIEENTRLLQQELSGRTPAAGVEVKLMRRDGSQFDARMYVSPLIDSAGLHTGWMTSITNITDAKRIRDQLTAAHERFTTVLEGLDAAVSVRSVTHGELLFANRSYRLWFGTDPRWHALLAGEQPEPTTAPVSFGTDDSDDLGGLPAAELTQASSEVREVRVLALDKWFEVRTRYLQWTDGRLTQMLIATDVTARRQVEEQAARQAERAQASSRLITMGEMASSVAHELNQPLTAIANYCSGMVSRVKAGSLSQESLIDALEKTSRQAQRAGQIIHRIRNFVKKSEPQRQATRAETIVEDTLELANIELRRRNVSIQSYVARRLPRLHVDPILIEQVLLNLIRNAAEAIDTAGMPKSRRHVELRVTPRHLPDLGGTIEFSVTDSGPGMKPEVQERLYEAFFSTKVEGMGIGLSLCRSIIESHQGRIKAENLYNGETITGCRFSFTLPVGTGAETFQPAEPS